MPPVSPMEFLRCQHSGFRDLYCVIAPGLKRFYPFIYFSDLLVERDVYKRQDLSPIETVWGVGYKWRKDNVL